MEFSAHTGLVDVIHLTANVYTTTTNGHGVSHFSLGLCSDFSKTTKAGLLSY